MSTEIESWIVEHEITKEYFGRYYSLDKAREVAAGQFNATLDKGWIYRKANPIRESIEEMSKPENNPLIPD